MGCVSAIFKCPDGYNGGYPRQAKRGVDSSNGVLDGYADFADDERRCNPFSNTTPNHYPHPLPPPSP